MKKRFSAEAAYLVGLVFLALGVALMEKADLGVSMVVAPAYVLYRWISPAWEAFTFGMAEYCFQALLLALLAAVVRRFRLSYLLSFATAVVYGLLLDGFMALCGPLPAGPLPLRILYFLSGMLLCSAGVAAMFRTYISPEVYELFVKEVSARFGLGITRVKTVYDCASCLAAVALSFLAFGLWNFVGVGWGTVLCALLNGWIIGRFSALYDRHLAFYDRFPWRGFFEAAR